MVHPERDSFDMRTIARLMVASALAGAVAACAGMPAETSVTAPQDSEEARIADIVARMSLERKVAQLIQPQINSVTPEEMRKYRWGSYLNGGNGGPYGDEFATADKWLQLADEMWDASTAPLPGGEPVIPTIWGTDAVHGHTNIVGATIFPHNVGLGATRDPDLLRRIGQATAVEIEVTGIDWNFSPTVAVARDDRWGRSYESYSENSELVASLGAALVEGLQGPRGTAEHLGEGRVIATAKHFFGDGGTEQGVDQGDVNGDIAALKSVHAVPYPAAIAAGVETIMASFNSINGTKMHGNKELLTDVLRGEMGFDGLVVGDWNAHGQIAGCTVSDCPQSLLAGLDIYMVPDDAVALYENLLKQVRSGVIPEAKVDEAVTRVLRVKMRAGLLGPDAKKPSARANAGDYGKLGSPEHRAIAREAVAKSQVILKNTGVLPLKAGANILVAGAAADSIAQASGGWTLTWQGGRELTNTPYFPGATSIWSGIEDAARAAGGKAMLSADGSYSAKPDAAVVVFGEQPYAEFAGDLKTMVFADEEGLGLLRKYKAAGIPTVAVFLSGRPLWVNRELNAADAFVASWLPGSEGAGVADVLFGKRAATGKLSFSWPAGCEGAPVNSPQGALFAYGYGLSLTQRSTPGTLDETCGFIGQRATADWYANGRLTAGITATAGTAALPNLRGEAGGVVARGLDKDRQEDARAITFGPGSSLTFGGAGEGAFVVTYNMASAPAGKVTVSGGTKTTDVTSRLTVASGKGWRDMVLTEACLGPIGKGLTIATDAPMDIQISRISRQALPEGTPCSF